MKSLKDIQKIVSQFNIKPRPEMRNKILDEALEIQRNRKQHRTSDAQLDIWRIIMKSRITKLAAAAVIIVVLLIGTYWSGGTIDGTNIALGKVIEKVEQVKNFSFQLKCRIKGMPNMPEVMEAQVKACYSSIDGYRFDTFVASDSTVESIMYILPAEKRVVNILPAMKRYSIRDLHADEWGQLWEDPKKIMEHCRNEHSIRIGRRNIDGIETEGFETTDPKGMKVTDPHSNGITFDKALTRIWVDVRTDLPVLIEKDCWISDSSEYMNITYNFKWDINLDKSIFEPNIPKDYVLEKTQ